MGTERSPVSTWGQEQNMAAHDNYLVALCKLGKLDKVHQAIADGASVNSKRNGITCLMAAVAKSHVEIVSLLLEHHEIAVNEKDESNQAAIHLACGMGNMRIIRMLLGKGADSNSRGLDGRTCLIIAVGSDHQDVVYLLLEQPGVDIDAMDDFGQRALHYASFFYDLTIFQKLLDAGADVNSKGAGNGTCLAVAVTRNHEDLVTLLVAQPDIDIDAKCGNNITAMYYACIFGNLTILRKLLESGANVTCRVGKTSDTYLIVAVRNEDEDVVSLLLEHPDLEHIDAMNSCGETACSLSLSTCNVSIQAKLLEWNPERSTAQTTGTRKK